MVKNLMRPIHPGEILLEEFLKPAKPMLNSYKLAKALEVPPNRITRIVRGELGMSGDTAVRLGPFFEMSADFWMNVQKTYDLRLTGKALPRKVFRHIEENREMLASV